MEIEYMIEAVAGSSPDNLEVRVAEAAVSVVGRYEECCSVDLEKAEKIGRVRRPAEAGFGRITAELEALADIAELDALGAFAPGFPSAFGVAVHRAFAMSLQPVC
jgi:hypothetical protein